MITAAVSAAIAGLLALFGVKLTVYQMAAVVLVVKVLVVVTGVFFGNKLMKRRQAAASAEKPADPQAPAAKRPT